MQQDERNNCQHSFVGRIKVQRPKTEAEAETETEAEVGAETDDAGTLKINSTVIILFSHQITRINKTINFSEKNFPENNREEKKKKKETLEKQNFFKFVEIFK